MNFFRLWSIGPLTPAGPTYVTYEASILGAKILATQWQQIPIPYLKASTPRVEIHYFGETLRFDGLLHSPLMLPLVLWLIKTRARWELDNAC